MTELHPKIARAKANVVLKHPFFAALLLRRPIIEDAKGEVTPTLGVTDNGQIYYNPAFCEKLNVNQLVFGLCHEVLHYASLHPVRRGSRDHMMFNLAGDAWINSILQDMQVGEVIPGGVNCPGGMLNVPDAHKRTVEQIYDELMQQAKKIEKMGSGAGGEIGNDMKGRGKGDGDKDNKEGNGEEGRGRPMTESEKAELEAQVKLEVAEAQQAAKMRGNMPGQLAGFVADIIESKVPWFDILERFMTERVKNDYSWARPNRRYAPEFYLPSMDGIGSMGEVVIQVDISGSVSKKEIEHYNGHLKRIVEQCKPKRVHVLYTDTSVQRHEEYEDLEDVEIKFYSGGGTDMRAGFQYIENKGIEPEVFVTLTDGYTPFPNDGDYETPAIWCISSDVKSPSGETVPFKVED